MKKTNIPGILIPALLAIILIYMMFQFIFGELGVQRSYARAQRIVQLKQTIAVLEQIKKQKERLITGLTSHDATIAAYAAQYGLRSNGEIKGTPLPNPLLPPLEPVIPDKRPLLLRHPELLLIAITIIFALITYGFLFRTKKTAETRPAVTLNRNRYISPDWNR